MDTPQGSRICASKLLIAMSRIRQREQFWFADTFYQIVLYCMPTRQITSVFFSLIASEDKLPFTIGALRCVGTLPTPQLMDIGYVSFVDDFTRYVWTYLKSPRLLFNLSSWLNNILIRKFVAFNLTGEESIPMSHPGS